MADERVASSERGFYVGNLPLDQLRERFGTVWKIDRQACGQGLACALNVT
ncbi:hypothetical protein [Xanthomonas arboricola]|nr:hypothetical protein [Xanthomonas arboricola]